MLRAERRHWQDGRARVAGLDEAGRGPLAGPVVAAAVILDARFAEAELERELGLLTDSKKLSETRRESFSELLQNSSFVEIGVGFSEVEEIEELNILNATHLAMARAVRDLSALPDHILVDGLPVGGLPCPSTPIVGGDARSLSIAAASVVAKVVRDHCMQEVDRLYPQYGFARHKGYGSRVHIQALFEHGPCPIHRRTFRPVREAAAIRLRNPVGRERDS